MEVKTYCQSCQKMKSNVVKLVCCEDWACRDCLEIVDWCMNSSDHAKYHCRGNIHSSFKELDRKQELRRKPVFALLPVGNKEYLNWCLLKSLKRIKYVNE